MNKPFQFKKFRIEQDLCAMKVGTDGILLGSWTSIEYSPDYILDIGAGTGLLSLMLAQRCPNASIHSIDIDKKAHIQSTHNYKASPWRERLTSYHTSLNDFKQVDGRRYDLIICNPPFFKENYKTMDVQRDLARFQDAMPFDNLLQRVASLLNPLGSFSLIIPYTEEAHFISLASQESLYPYRITRIKGTPTSPIIRSLIQLSSRKKETVDNDLIIEYTRHNYTEDFIQLTQNFYINM